MSLTRGDGREDGGAAGRGHRGRGGQHGQLGQGQDGVGRELQLAVGRRDFTELEVNSLVVVSDQTEGDDNCYDEEYYHKSVSRRYLHCYGHSLLTRQAGGGGGWKY